jgi:hypothetical protein
MQIRGFLTQVLVVTVLGVCAASTPRAAGEAQAPRSFEMAIPGDEMLSIDGGLQARAREAVRRMDSVAREHAVRLTVQVPADAPDARAEIERLAPSSVVKLVPSGRPFKLVARVGGHADYEGSSPAASATGPVREDSNSPIVHIHLRNESQSAVARRYALRLRQLGASLSEVEVVVAEGPRRRQLRYFHPGDRREAALLASGLGEGPVQLLDLSKEYGNAVPARHYELWLAPDEGMP